MLYFNFLGHVDVKIRGPSCFSNVKYVECRFYQSRWPNPPFEYTASGILSKTNLEIICPFHLAPPRASVSLDVVLFTDDGQNITLPSSTLFTYNDRAAL